MDNQKHKTKYVKVMLDEEDHALLGYKARTAGLSRSEFIRTLLYHGSAERHSHFTSEDARMLHTDLCNIANSMAQIAYCAKIKCAVDEGDFSQLESSFKSLLFAFEKCVIS